MIQAHTKAKLMSFSRVQCSDAFAMGVRLKPAVMFDRLSREVEESGLPEEFLYKKASSIASSDYQFFDESGGTEAFQSTVGRS